MCGVGWGGTVLQSQSHGMLLRSMRGMWHGVCCHRNQREAGNALTGVESDTSELVGSSVKHSYALSGRLVSEVVVVMQCM